MRFTCLIMLAISAASFAEDPFACVDPDVVNAFLGSHYGGNTEYSTAIPPGFGGLDVPAGFSLIGSQNSGTVATVIYKSASGAGPALQAAIDTMAKSGWRDMATQQQRTMGGFQTHVIPAHSTLCHDEQPYAISVNASARGGDTFVGFTRFDGAQGCETDALSPPRHHTMNMMEQMPTLTLPDGVSATNQGMSGSGDEVSSQVDISGAAGSPELISHFERQIQAQGWEYQTSWASRLSSGSVWLLNSDDNGPLIGTLHLLDSGNQPVHVRFSIIPAKTSNHSKTIGSFRRSG